MRWPKRGLAAVAVAAASLGWALWFYEVSTEPQRPSELPTWARDEIVNGRVGKARLCEEAIALRGHLEIARGADPSAVRRRALAQVRSCYDHRVRPTRFGWTVPDAR